MVQDASVKVASDVLLSYLDLLQRFSAPLCDLREELRSGMLPPTAREKELKDYREDVDRLSKQMETCSWMVATLNRTLYEVKQIGSLASEIRAAALRNADQCARERLATIRLPNEVLSNIAQFVFPKPISFKEAVRLRSSGCKWDKVVLKASLVKLDKAALKSPVLPDLLVLLTASSPAKLVIEVEGFNPSNTLQTLLPFRHRWHALSVVIFRGKSGKKAHLALPCPNCPPSSPRAKKKCENHTILPSMYSFTTDIDNHVILSFSGLLRNIRHLCLTVMNIISSAPIHYSLLATEAPSLSELTVYWRAKSNWRPFKPEETPVLLPKLRKVVFIQATPVSRWKWFNFAFDSLDGSMVEDLGVYVLHADTEVEPDEESMAKVLGKIFPSVKSFALRAIPYARGNRDEMLEMQSNFLDWMPSQIFPQLTHLSLELDDRKCKDAVETTLEFLNARRDSKQEILSLTLLTRYPEYNFEGILSKLRPCVENLVVGSSDELPCYAPVLNTSDWEWDEEDGDEDDTDGSENDTDEVDE